MAQETTLLVTTVKNEGPNILEWVAYHRLCGFDNIQVYYNDTTDLMERSLRTMDRLGLIEQRPNFNPTGAHQILAYRRATQSETYKNSDWCMVLDGDEFLNVKIGNRQVSDLINACPETDAILVNWKRFGSNNLRNFGNDLVIERFTRAEKDALISEGEFAAYKPIYRTNAFTRPGIHLPKFPLIESPRICNGSGLMDGEFRRKNWRGADPLGRKFAQVNHYIVRDMKSFLLKNARGSANAPMRKVGARYWEVHNRNEEEDLELANRSDEVWQEMRRIDEMADGRLMHLRTKSLRMWRKHFEDLRDNVDLQALRKTIDPELETSGQTVT
ncbi:MAG: glycosyltransferase family 2 protein [Paracoccaceae bacterium]